MTEAREAYWRKELEQFSCPRVAIVGWTELDQERIYSKDLEEQIERQRLGALITEEHCKKLEKENAILRGGLAIGGNFEKYKSVGIW